MTMMLLLLCHVTNVYAFLSISTNLITNKPQFSYADNDNVMNTKSPGKHLCLYLQLQKYSNNQHLTALQSSTLLG